MKNTKQKKMVLIVSMSILGMIGDVMPPIIHLSLYLLGVGLRHFEQLDEAVQQRHADGPQQHLEAGLHQLGQALHQAALTAVHLVVGRHHVRDEGVVG